MAFAYTKLMQAMSAVGIVTDPDFEYVTLLLPGNGTNGAQNNTFTDGSSNAFSITRNGNTTQGTFSPYGDNWSNYFDGTGDNFSLTGVTAVGNSDATVEFFIFPTDSSLTYRSVFDSRSTTNTDTGFGIFQYGLTIEVYGNGLKVSSAASALNINKWNHVVLTRSSGTCQIYINGSTSGSSATYSSNLTSTAVRIADSVNTSFPYVGYISNLRVVVGSVVYSGSTYTVPTAPLTAITNTSLLTCQSNRFIDNSSNAFAITVNGNTSVQRFSPFSPTAAYASGTIGGSGYFDGSGDYLDTGVQSNLYLNASDYTIEFWAYFTRLPGTANSGTQQTPLTQGDGAWFGNNNEHNWLVLFDTNTFYFGKNPNFYTLTYTPPINTWIHYAIVGNSSGSITVYINGVSQGTQTGRTALGSASWSTRVGLGFYGDTKVANYFQGYMNDVRIVKGTQVYTGNFTPPTAPLTAITNTQLILNYTNAGIIDNAMMNDLETVGNAQISTTQSKFGGSSMYFDGSGDGVTAPSNNIHQFGTGDFTIEFWVYINSFASNRVLFDIANGNVLQLYTNTIGVLAYYTPSTDRITSSALSTSTWYHVALARSGTSTKLFVNGTQAGSTYTDSTNYAAGGIGVGSRFDATIPLNGYIDDLRITKGVARYTANFTAPTAAFPTS